MPNIENLLAIKMLKIGDKVPDLELSAYFPDRDEIGQINLQEYKGKWLILLFYPADFTFVCPTELEDAANKYEEFKKLGAEIISVSTDTAYVHKAWHDHSQAISKVQYPMIGDPAGKLCKLFGTYIEEEGLSLRGTFIIDPDGCIINMDIHSNDIGRNIEEIFRKFQAAKYVQEHEGVVCPANWTPGKEVLKPSIDLIGKI